MAERKTEWHNFLPFQIPLPPPVCPAFSCEKERLPAPKHRIASVAGSLSHLKEKGVCTPRKKNMQKSYLSPILYRVFWTIDSFLFFTLVNAITCNLPKPLQVPRGLPQSPERWQPPCQAKLLQCRLQMPREEWLRMLACAEAVPMPWNDENKSLVCTTQRRRLSPLLMSAMQRTRVTVLLNSAHVVHLRNTTPKRSSAHIALRAQHVGTEVPGQVSLSHRWDICPSTSNGSLGLEIEEVLLGLVSLRCTSSAAGAGVSGQGAMP